MLFSASEELAEQIVEDLPRNLDDIFMPRDRQLGLVALGKNLPLNEHGVAVGDEDSGAKTLPGSISR